MDFSLASKFVPLTSSKPDGGVRRYRIAAADAGRQRPCREPKMRRSSISRLCATPDRFSLSIGLLNRFEHQFLDLPAWP
jgi:hypothetical protein